MRSLFDIIGGLGLLVFQVAVTLLVFNSVKETSSTMILAAIGLFYCEMSMRLKIIEARMAMNDPVQESKIDRVMSMLRLGLVGLTCVAQIVLHLG